MRSLQTEMTRQRERSPARYVTLLVGLSLLAFLGYREYLGIFKSERGPDTETITTVRASGDGAVDRVQVVLCVLLDGPVAPPSALHEWIFPADALDAGVEFFRDAPRFSAQLRWSRPGSEPDRDRAGHQERLLEGMSSTVSRVDLPYSSMTVSTSGATPVDLSLDDDRRFSRIAGVIGSGPLSLRSNRDECILLARPLRVDDTIGMIPADRARAAIGLGLRMSGALASTTSQMDELTGSPIGRILSGGHPVGVMFLLAGVALLFHGRLSLLRGAAILLTAWVLGMSLSSRLETASLVSRLRSEDPGVRAAAAGRLATSEAFAPTAARALRAAYEVEKDPSVRAAIVYSLIQGLPIESLAEVGNLLDVAARDPDPIVQRAISRREAAPSADQG